MVNGPQNKTETSDAPNPYAPSRRMLGRFAPGIRRAVAPGQVIADDKKMTANFPIDIAMLAILAGLVCATMFITGTHLSTIRLCLLLLISMLICSFIPAARSVLGPGPASDEQGNIIKGTNGNAVREFLKWQNHNMLTANEINHNIWCTFDFHSGRKSGCDKNPDLPPTFSRHFRN